MPYLSNNLYFDINATTISNGNTFTSRKAGTGEYVQFFSVYVTAYLGDPIINVGLIDSSNTTVHWLHRERLVKKYTTFLLFSKENIGLFTDTDTIRGFQVSNIASGATTSLHIYASMVYGT